jgi:DNA-directed RNA polymerase I subunit RPA43
MSAAADGDSQDAVVSSVHKSEKKHKRTKSDHKKRSRDDDDAAVVEETPRKSKKTKSRDVDDDAPIARSKNVDATTEEPAKRKKKKERKGEDIDLDEAQDATADEPKRERKKSSKRAKEVEQPIEEPMDVDEPEPAPADEGRKGDKKRKEKKSKKHQAEADEQTQRDETTVVLPERTKRKGKGKGQEGSVADTPTSHETEATQDSAAELPTDPEFPFFTQAISLYVPFFPIGFDKPLTNVAAQHLDPLLNHYSPVLRGVLLSYANLNLSDRPAKASITHPPTDQTPALLHSIDEYAVGFGWLTFDAHLFVPSRGSWMEGVVQLQSEGHIGVVCWNKFNASIEAKRLPEGWSWVDLSKGGPKPNHITFSDDNEGEQQDQEEEEDMLDGEELQVVEQIHTTGYWVNEKGRKVSGKLRFRIKNFDVGLAGDYGYLSIEGTCLDDAAEKALGSQERSLERARQAKQNPAGILRPLSRRLPEFSMTKFGREDQEEDDGKRTVLYKGSRPGTPDD